jgi:hypothetical protein
MRTLKKGGNGEGAYKLSKAGPTFSKSCGHFQSQNPGTFLQLRCDKQSFRRLRALNACNDDWAMWSKVYKPCVNYAWVPITPCGMIGYNCPSSGVIFKKITLQLSFVRFDVAGIILLAFKKQVDSLPHDDVDVDQRMLVPR